MQVWRNMRPIGQILVIISLISFAVISYAEETIRITNGEWLPYHSEKLHHYGAGSQIVTEAFALGGIKVKWGFFPWKRGYVYAVTGKWDASIGWIKIPKREKEVLFSDPVYGGKWVFFYRKDYPFDWNMFEDLKGITIGATANYTYGKAFDEAEKNKIIYVERVSKEILNFRKLLFGRIRIFAHAMDGGYATLRKHFNPEQVQQITHHPKPIQIVNYHLVLTKNERNERMLKLFNKGLKHLHESGKVEQYLQDAWNKHSE